MLDNIFGIAGSALNAQMVRLNATASNLANAATVAPTEAGAFRAQRVVFKTLLQEAAGSQSGTAPSGGVQVDRLVQDTGAISRQYDPGNPMADPDGYVYGSNVNEMTEMVEMMAASRSYQNNVEMINTTRQLMLRTVETLRG
jgi:flagellar basal-body rod protein FlgC